MAESPSGALDLTNSPGGTRLRLRVRPGAKRAGVLGVHAGALRIGVTAPPERGKANRAVLALLAEILELRPADLEILAGHGSPDKSVCVRLPCATVRNRLAAILDA